MDKNATASPLKVIILADNLADFRLIKIACQKLLFKVDLTHFEKGIDPVSLFGRQALPSVRFGSFQNIPFANDTRWRQILLINIFKHL